MATRSLHPQGRQPRTRERHRNFSHEGLQKIEVKHASEGDIVGLTGFEDVFIGETITDSEERKALPFTEIDPPTITMKSASTTARWRDAMGSC